jgi:hypothetical protein
VVNNRKKNNGRKRKNVKGDVGSWMIELLMLLSAQ